MASETDILPSVTTTGTETASETNIRTAKKSRCEAFRSFIGSPSCFIYFNFFLSQWGDWMWQFSVGLYLVHMCNDELLLAAIFGFTAGGFVLLFGGLIGDWVDRNQRLRVVRISLFTQNLSVAVSCVAVCVRLSLDKVIHEPLWQHLLEAGIIAMAIMAQLASVAYKIAIEKDWLVVIAAGKSGRLANLNAVTRSLDLLCKLLSPMAAGLVMRYSSLETSAIVIAGWNVVSVFIEYTILSRVYRLVPQLAIKQMDNGKAEPKEREMFEITVSATDKEARDELETERLNEPTGAADGEPQSTVSSEHRDEPEEKSCCRKMFEPVLVLIYGWKTYSQQSVVYASIALSFLYMTVLGFDSITVGYIYASGVNELITSICMALGGFTGILGTMLFTRLRRWIGLERTGLVAFNLEILCLTLAVVSVWMPGSPFDPHYASRPTKVPCNESQMLRPADDVTMMPTDALHFSTASALINQSFVVTFSDDNSSNTSASINDISSCDLATLNISIILFLVGIISSRIGLWMADLVVTQLMQEAVAENERGIVNGVQNSLNMFMDMLKFVLVIALPQIEIFGVHILLSFSFIVAAGCLFAFHSWRVRGHLFHFSKLRNLFCCCS